jgi:hypothetical protein
MQGANSGKSALRTKIRGELARHALGEEFECELIADLIVEKHYYCSKHGLRPLRFRKSFRYGGGYDFEGFFANGIGWHKVSWTQCLDERDSHDWLVRVLRDCVAPIIADYKRRHPICESCRVFASEHVDHVEPEFNELATLAIACLSDEQIADEFKKFDFFAPEQFSLPASNPARQFILCAHENAKLQAVCKGCHQRNAAARRKPRRCLGIASGIKAEESARAK